MLVEIQDAIFKVEVCNEYASIFAKDILLGVINLHPYSRFGYFLETGFESSRGLEVRGMIVEVTIGPFDFVIDAEYDEVEISAPRFKFKSSVSSLLLLVSQKEGKYILDAEGDLNFRTETSAKAVARYFTVLRSFLR